MGYDVLKIFLRQSYCIAQAGLKVEVQLPQPLKKLDYKVFSTIFGSYNEHFGEPFSKEPLKSQHVIDFHPSVLIPVIP